MADQSLRERFPEANLKLDDNQLRVVEKRANSKTYRDGETIIAAGTRDPNFYVIKSGEVDVVEYSAGRPQIIWTSYPKELLGDVSFLSRKGFQSQPCGKGQVEVFEILPENLRRIIDEEPKLGNIILATLIARMQIMRALNFTPLRVIGSRFSSDAFRIRDFLTKNRVVFSWVDLEGDSNATHVLQQIGVADEDTPVVAWEAIGFCVTRVNESLPSDWGFSRHSKRMSTTSLSSVPDLLG